MLWPGPMVGRWATGMICATYLPISTSKTTLGNDMDSFLIFVIGLDKSRSLHKSQGIIKISTWHNSGDRVVSERLSIYLWRPSLFPHATLLNRSTSEMQTFHIVLLSWTPATNKTRNLAVTGMLKHSHTLKLDHGICVYYIPVSAKIWMDLCNRIFSIIIPICKKNRCSLIVFLLIGF